MSDFLQAISSHLDREPETASMRRAKRWLAEMQTDATALGREIDSANLRLFAHLTGCRRCQLRANMDPEFCDVADGMLDGEDTD